MKKAVAIALFVCFAIYHFGYYAFYLTYQRHIEGQWVKQIYDEQLQDYSEILIEVPLSIPYMANQDDFRPTNTPFEKDGKYFRVVKQRYQNDTLQLIAVPDTARKVLDSTVKKWISFLTDDEIPQDQKSKTSINLLVKDYIQTEKYNLEFIKVIKEINSPEFVSSIYSNPFFRLTSPPPQIG
ncbi:hypothetical protein [Algoriphagus marinus]|uniref:hypothetical protein n=1 Tax=Algoriphagus marinus TaxID=1925762 RepID=UPI00094B915D|nr:hypothetical protein [Algoriphagus marinus]